MVEIISSNSQGFHKNILFNILTELSYVDITDFQKRKGVFTHNSYRFDKSDVSPQPKLIKMAESMIEYTK
jgi:hypothetical protein